VVICYDSDNAGLKAAQRAIDILEKTGLNVKVLNVPGAKDPDEFIKEKEPTHLKLSLKRARTI
jgi:DNA primase